MRQKWLRLLKLYMDKVYDCVSGTKRKTRYYLSWDYHITGQATADVHGITFVLRAADLVRYRAPSGPELNVVPTDMQG